MYILSYRRQLAGTNVNNRTNIELDFKNNAPFRLCIKKLITHL